MSFLLLFFYLLLRFLNADLGDTFVWSYTQNRRQNSLGSLCGKWRKGIGIGEQKHKANNDHRKGDQKMKGCCW